MTIRLAQTTALLAGLVLAPAALPAQACPAPDAMLGGRTEQPFAAVRYLSDDALEGRMSGSPGERCAGEYIASEFRRLGLQPLGDDGTYFQSLPLKSALHPHAPGGTGRNVVAILEGADPALREEAVVIGAHYDHLGLGGAFSLAPDSKDAIHNGADDNASGVGALLSVAERLAAGPRPARSVVFLAFSGEELGLLGSEHYAKHPGFPLERTRAMLNMDMVGRLGADPLIVYGTDTADEWNRILDAATEAERVPVLRRGDGYGASDHTSFYARDVPVLHFFTNVHDDYHRPSDDWEKVDVEGVSRVAALVTRIARDVAGRPAALSLRRGAGEPPQMSQGSGYGAYLGTIPDFSPVDFGVRITGVREGSPAEEAGLRAGDVIIGFDGAEIADLYKFTDALRTHEAGDEVEITVLRDGKKTSVTAVLAERSER